MSILFTLRNMKYLTNLVASCVSQAREKGGELAFNAGTGIIPEDDGVEFGYRVDL